MIEIIPAIIAKDFEELEKKIKLVEPYVKWAQLDVMDGKFAPEKSWDNPRELKNISTSLNLEAHLMVSEPEKEIEKWINSGVKKILIHIESTKNVHEIIKKIKGAGLKAGVVLNLETDVAKIEPFADSVDLVQFMAIAQIGYHGHPFDDKVIPKIIALRQKYPNVKIAVDGGINSETAQKTAQAGADILVAGSAIFAEGNIEKAINELRQSINN
jgi:ribulose-phosphate 3-epimerase